MAAEAIGISPENDEEDEEDDNIIHRREGDDQHKRKLVIACAYIFLYWCLIEGSLLVRLYKIQNGYQ